jgi:hypothetical protein
MLRRLALSLVVVTSFACGPASPPAKAPDATAGPAQMIFFVGGDARGDASHVLPWSLKLAKDHGARAFFFLGDMEAKPDEQPHFVSVLDASIGGAYPFYPVPGNHDLARRALGAESEPAQRAAAEASFRTTFLGNARAPVKSAFDDKIVYAVDLDGGVHFVALDNVSQPGFGADQLDWLARDLRAASTHAKHLFVGMHKPLAKNGFTTHSMDEEGDKAIADSEAALATMKSAHVEAIFVSHFHGYKELSIGGIPMYVTGGLGAPLDDKHGPDVALHHVLELRVVGDDRPVQVTLLKFPGAPSYGSEHGE